MFKRKGGGGVNSFFDQKNCRIGVVGHLRDVKWQILFVPQGRVEKLEHNDNSSDPDPVVKRSWSVGEVIFF